jgi:hypothetical protein
VVVAGLVVVDDVAEKRVVRPRLHLAFRNDVLEPGLNVMISEIFSPKNRRKYWRFWLKIYIMYLCRKIKP